MTREIGEYLFCVAVGIVGSATCVGAAWAVSVVVNALGRAM